MNTLGRRLKDVLREKGFTQKELAANLEMPEATISNILKDKAEPGVFKIMLIASYLNIDLNWLITGRCFQEDNEKNKEGFVFHDHRVNERPGAYSPEQKKLLNVINQLTPDQQKKLLKIIRVTFLSENDD